MVIEQPPPHFPGRMNGAACHDPQEAVLYERRFTLLEVASENHGRRLDRLESRQEALARKLAPKPAEAPTAKIKAATTPRIPDLMKVFASAAGSWAGGMAMMHYVSNGGSAAQLIGEFAQALIKAWQ